MKNIITFTDGGARGNPGPAAIGVVIKDNAQTIEAFGRYIGETTNNQAEYQALIAALEKVRDLGADEVWCNLDSELLVKQLNGEYKVKNRDLAPLFLKLHNLTLGFKKISFHHIPRARNSEADAEVNKALDARTITV